MPQGIVNPMHKEILAGSVLSGFWTLYKTGQKFKPTAVVPKTLISDYYMPAQNTLQNDKFETTTPPASPKQKSEEFSSSTSVIKSKTEKENKVAPSPQLRKVASIKPLGPNWYCAGPNKKGDLRAEMYNAIAKVQFEGSPSTSIRPLLVKDSRIFIGEPELLPESTDLPPTPKVAWK